MSLIDTVTIIDYYNGKLTEEEIIHMCADLCSSGQIDDMPKHFSRLVNKYVKAGVIDEEGAINYIKLKEYL